eukprot:UN01570
MGTQSKLDFRITVSVNLL